MIPLSSLSSRLPPAGTLALAPAALPLAPAALTVMQIVGAGLVAASSALLLQRNLPAARQAMDGMARRLGERLEWRPEQIAAATRYLQGPGLEQLRFTGVSAGAFAAELWNKLEGIVAFVPAPPQPAIVQQPGPSSPRLQVRPSAPQPEQRPPPLLLAPTDSSRRSNPAPGLRTAAGDLEGRVAALQRQVQGLDQTRTLSVADIRSAGGQRAEFIARINALRAQIGALAQRASSAMAQGLSAQDYLGLSGQLERLDATLAGLPRGYDTAMTNALQRSVAGVEAAIANGRPLPLGQDDGIYRQLANHLQWFSRQAGLQVFSERSRTGFEGRVAAALLPATAPPPQRPTGPVLTRSRGPSTGADAAIREEHARQEQARRLQQALEAARREMRQLLPGAGYAQQAEEILARVAQRYRIDPDALRAALDSAPAAPGNGITGPVAGPPSAGGETGHNPSTQPSRNLPNDPENGLASERGAADTPIIPRNIPESAFEGSIGEAPKIIYGTSHWENLRRMMSSGMMNSAAAAVKHTRLPVTIIQPFYAQEWEVREVTTINSDPIRVVRSSVTADYAEALLRSSITTLDPITRTSWEERISGGLLAQVLGPSDEYNVEQVLSGFTVRTDLSDAEQLVDRAFAIQKLQVSNLTQAREIDALELIQHLHLSNPNLMPDLRRAGAADFMAIGVGRLPDGSLVRIHVYPVSSKIIGDAHDHSHRTPIRSWVLTGGLVNQVSGVMDNPQSGEGLFSVNYSGLESILRDTGRRIDVHAIHRGVFRAGETYEMPALFFGDQLFTLRNVFHRVATIPNEETVTLFVFEGTARPTDPFVVENVGAQLIRNAHTLALDEDSRQRFIHDLERRLQDSYVRRNQNER